MTATAFLHHHHHLIKFFFEKWTELNRFMCVCLFFFISIFTRKTTTAKIISVNLRQSVKLKKVTKKTEKKNLTWKFNAVFLHFTSYFPFQKLTKENPIDRWSRKKKWKVHHHQQHHLRNVSEQGFISNSINFLKRRLRRIEFKDKSPGKDNRSSSGYRNIKYLFFFVLTVFVVVV